MPDAAGSSDDCLGEWQAKTTSQEFQWDGGATAVNKFPTSLPRQFIAREGEAPAEPLHRWLGRSLALPKVFNGIDFAKMFRAVG